MEPFYVGLPFVLFYFHAYRTTFVRLHCRSFDVSEVQFCVVRLQLHALVSMGVTLWKLHSNVVTASSFGRNIRIDVQFAFGFTDFITWDCLFSAEMCDPNIIQFKSVAFLSFRPGAVGIILSIVFIKSTTNYSDMLTHIWTDWMNGDLRECLGIIHLL